MDLERPDIIRRAMSGHRHLALHLLRALHILKKDLCGINNYGPLSDSARTGLELDLLEQIGYASCFWIDHLYASPEWPSISLSDKIIGYRYRLFNRYRI